MFLRAAWRVGLNSPVKVKKALADIDDFAAYVFEDALRICIVELHLVAILCGAVYHSRRPHLLSRFLRSNRTALSVCMSLAARMRNFAYCKEAGEPQCTSAALPVWHLPTAAKLLATCAVMPT